jgi:hypothetical protein
MRQGQQNRRGRGRGRKSANPLTRSYESNGPDVKIRGTAAHIAEKYVSLARDALVNGDVVQAEGYLQHAEHYNRIIMSSQPVNQPGQGDGVNGSPQRVKTWSLDSDPDDDDGDDDGQDYAQQPQPQIQHREGGQGRDGGHGREGRDRSFEPRRDGGQGQGRRRFGRGQNGGRGDGQGHGQDGGDQPVNGANGSAPHENVAGQNGNGDGSGGVDAREPMPVADTSQGSDNSSG